MLSPWRNRLARSAVTLTWLPKGWWFKPTRGRLFSSLFFSFFVTKAARTLDTLFPRRRLEFSDVNVH